MSETLPPLHGRANPDFFDALVALRLLDRDGDGADARYRSTVAPHDSASSERRAVMAAASET